MYKVGDKIASFTVSNRVLSKLIIAVILFLYTGAANAQCAMCRAALGGDANTKKAAAVNDGIVYLMVVPYLLVVIIGYIIYKMYSAKKK